MAASLLQTLWSLGLVLGLIFALAWLARRLRGMRAGGSGAAMQVESALQLGAKERLLLVRVEGQQFLLGVAPGSVQLMHRFPAAAQARSAEVVNFSQYLKTQP